jgi:hypothetical protein
MNKHFNVLTHTGHMESPNLVASCVDELGDTLPHFTGVQWDSVRATYDVPTKAYAWKTTLGMVGPDLTSWPRRELLPLVLPSWPTCVMLSCLYPCMDGY